MCIRDRERARSQPNEAFYLPVSTAVQNLFENEPWVEITAHVTDEARMEEAKAQIARWWALALGADLGGNATAVGASANVVVTGIAKRNGHPISFWEFTKYGLVVTVVTIVAAAPYLYWRYYA